MTARLTASFVILKVLFCVFETSDLLAFQQAISFERIWVGSVVTESKASTGTSWVDFDNDADFDIFVVNRDGQTNDCYINEGNDVFSSLLTGDIVEGRYDSFGATWGDYNNDGLIDVYIANKGQENLLFQNLGSRAFGRVLNGEVVEETELSHAASFGDFNNDGYLDIFVANDRGNNNSLYKNNGDGTFMKVVDVAPTMDGGYSTNCQWADVDNDGVVDLFVTNWQEPDFLYKNNGDGTFTKINEGDIVTDVGSTFGASWGDVNNDGLLDVFVVNDASEQFPDGENNTLYINNGNFDFTRDPDNIVSTDHGLSFGSSFADVDNDGDLDLFVSNKNDKDNYLYENKGDGSFEKIIINTIIDDEGYSYGAAWGDFDNNGYPDLYVVNQNQGNYLYKNTASGNHWLTIQLVGTVSNQSAIGTRVRLKSKIFGSDIWQVREISGLTGGGYSGQNSLNAAFGLGDAVTADSLEVLWPSGITQVITAIAADQFVLAIEESDVFLSKYILKFNEVTEGDSATTDLVITNSLPTDVSITGVSISGTDADDFATNLESGLSLTRDSMHQIVVSFKPNSEGQKRAQLLVWYEGSAMPLRLILEGDARAAPRPGIETSTSVVFGLTGTMETAIDTLHVLNSGNASLRIESAIILNDQNGEFQVTGEFPVDVQPNQKYDIVIKMTPVSAGDKSALLQIQSNASETPVVVELSGKAFESDPEAPVHHSLTYSRVLDYGQNLEVFSDLTDNHELAEAKIYYRINNEPNFASKNMSWISDSTYSVSIESSEFGDTGLEFYIEATDSAGNSSKSDHKGVVIQLPSKHFKIHHRGGDVESAYCLISFPLFHSDPSVESILLDDLGKPDSLSWRLWEIDPGKRELDFPYREIFSTGSLVPGEARFLITLKDVELTSGAGVTADIAGPFEIELGTGWNLIANPFNFSVPVSQVYPESLRTHIITFSDSGWTLGVSELKPFEGYAVRAIETTTLTIEPSPRTDSIDSLPNPEVAAKPAKIETNAGWALRLVATSGHATDGNNFVGVAPHALPGWDGYERFDPPPIGRFVRLSFIQDDWEVLPGRYTTDFRPPGANKYEWRITIDTASPNALVTLSIQGLKMLPTGFEVFLVDPATRTAHDFLQKGSYNFVTGSFVKERTFSLVVGPMESIEEAIGLAEIPSRLQIESNFPNPFNPSTTIKFGLPEPDAITIDLFDILGRKIRTLVMAAGYDKGYHAIVWDGRDDRGVNVTSGVYILKLTTANGRSDYIKMTLLR